jgi:hypothetical protein
MSKPFRLLLQRERYLLIGGRETEGKMKIGLFLLCFVVLMFEPVYARSDCLSDFDCGIGYRCVKAPYKA